MIVTVNLKFKLISVIVMLSVRVISFFKFKDSLKDHV